MQIIYDIFCNECTLVMSLNSVTVTAYPLYVNLYAT